MTNFEKVGVFMKTFNQDVKDSSSLSTDKINSLRISLINLLLTNNYQYTINY